jgi:CheY-like chemotaxis protein
MADDRQGRVLVVEDNEVNQALAVAVLAKLGYRSGVAGDGRLLESFLARIPVDLADLRTAFHHGDSARALRVAHRLKGAAATVGSRQPRGPEAARPGGAG